MRKPPARPPGLDHGIVVVGAGFAGIGMAMRLKQAGIDDFVLLEKDSDLGGTWRDNTYPGCACDVPSYLYSFSFEPYPHWSRMFAPAEEIWGYLRHCVDAHGLAPHIRYRTEVTGARFDESTGTWDVEIVGGGSLRCRVLILGPGALHVSAVPALPGLQDFAGTTLHSARWDHEHDLTGRRVAVIGTGASSIQLVPQIAGRVTHLTVFQRTPPWITPKWDRRIGERERRLHARTPIAQRAIRDLLYWVLEARGTGFAVSPRAMKPIERAARRHLAHQVADPVLRAKLTPDYQIGCKRILLSNDYYPSLQRDNVELVTEPVARVRRDGIVTRDGVEHPVDTIIFGTGFRVAANLTALKLVGRGGEDLAGVWAREGAGAHLGMTVAGFPNLFLLVGPNTGLGHASMVFMIEAQVRYILQALRIIRHEDVRYLDVRPRIQRAFVDRVQGRLTGSVWQSGCLSWYLDARGRNVTIWPDYTWRYWLATRRLRRSDFHIARRVAGSAQRSEPV
jgi:cation diffusion facilitator CzcD-associated flavoprotein CzcO